MKRTDCHAGHEDACLLRTKFRSQVDSYAAAVDHSLHSRIIIVDFQHIIRVLAVFRYRYADVFRQPFPCKTSRDDVTLIKLFLYVKKIKLCSLIFSRLKVFSFDFSLISTLDRVIDDSFVDILNVF